MTTPVIDLNRVTLRYGASEVLSELSLSVATGDFVCVIGPSGCGKTSLLRLVAGLTPPTEGTVTVRGAAPSPRPQAVGFVFQSPALYPWRRAVGNVAMPLELMGMAKAERYTLAQQRLAQVGLAGFERHYPWQLSGGMQQRVALARALVASPSVLLLDEPFAALDEITRDQLNDHLTEVWRASGATALFVTHAIPEAVYLASKIVVLSRRPGRVVAEIDCGPPPRRRDSPAFQALVAEVRLALAAAFV